MQEVIAMFFVTLLTIFINLGILALNIKLYTEFTKQRMQEVRK